MTSLQFNAFSRSRRFSTGEVHWILGKPKRNNQFMLIIKFALLIVSSLLHALMLAALFDVFHVGLHSTIAPFAYIPIALTLVLTIASVFLCGKPSHDSVVPQQLAKLEDGQNKLSGRMNAMQTALDGLQANLSDNKSRVDELAAADRSILLKENAALKQTLADLERAELQKATETASQLRQRNEDLESQIKQWALETVGQSIARKDAGQAVGDEAQAA